VVLFLAMPRSHSCWSDSASQRSSNWRSHGTRPLLADCWCSRRTYRKWQWVELRRSPRHKFSH